MKRIHLALPLLAVATFMSASVAQAYEPDWKVGRIYYRSICTACHTTANVKIQPVDRTKAEWTAYLLADKHNKGKDTVSLYFSKQYRDSIKATNKAAAKFAEKPEQELTADVKAFILRSSKDGEAPASCS
jgi:cytochrome c5